MLLIPYSSELNSIFFFLVVVTQSKSTSLVPIGRDNLLFQECLKTTTLPTLTCRCPDTPRDDKSWQKKSTKVLLTPESTKVLLTPHSRAIY